MTKKIISNAKQGKTQQAPHANELQPAETTELMAKVEEWLCNVTGIKSTEVAHQIWSQMLTMQVWGADLPHSQQLQWALQMIAELKPANATEALLAVQMCSVPGDPHTSPRCGAKTRRGCACQAPTMPNAQERQRNAA